VTATTQIPLSTPTSFRPDIDRLRALNNEPRPPERLLAHFELERDLAGRLRASSLHERSALYGELYTELFARLPDHPQHRIDSARRLRNTENQAAFLRTWLHPNAIYVEMGCGDAAVTHAVAPHVGQAVGVDVTDALIETATAPANFRFLKTAGTDIALPSAHADLVYSNQLMEHLHPEDASAQLLEIHRVLKPGGRYICVTPSRITGPHDISVYFGYEPTGFHLREYDHTALAAIFHAAGFHSLKALIAIKGRRAALPIGVAIAMEKILLALPAALRLRLAQIGPVRNIAGVTLIGRK